MTKFAKQNYKSLLLLIGLLFIIFPFFNKSSYKNASSVFLYNGHNSYFVKNKNDQTKLEFPDYQKKILWFHNTNSKKANGEIKIRELVENWNKIFRNNKVITAMSSWDKESKEKTVMIIRLSNPEIKEQKLSFTVDNINQNFIQYDKAFYKTTLFIS